MTTDAATDLRSPMPPRREDVALDLAHPCCVVERRLTLTSDAPPFRGIRTLVDDPPHAHSHWHEPAQQTGGAHCSAWNDNMHQQQTGPRCTQHVSPGQSAVAPTLPP
jgi:hypothetical protein